jgi:hypothetical protein
MLSLSALFRALSIDFGEHGRKRSPITPKR